MKLKDLLQKVSHIEPLPDPLEAETILKMSLSQFKKSGLLIRVRCRHLNNEDVFIASTEKEAEVGRAEGLIVYLADELLHLIKGQATPEEVRAVHRVKQSLGGVLTDVNPVKEEKGLVQKCKEMKTRTA